MREGSIKIVELVRGELAFLAGLELYPLVYYIRIGIVVMVHDNCVNLHFLSRNTYGHNKEGMLISLVDGGRGGRLGDRHSVIFSHRHSLVGKFRRSSGKRPALPELPIPKRMTADMP